MPKEINVRTQQELNELTSEIGRLWLQGKRDVRVQIIDATGTRTPTQNAALHLWLEWISQALNDAGYDMLSFPWKDGIDLPWSQHSAKERLWRPVQEAMKGKESTTECDKLEYSDIQEALCRHLATILPGFVPPPWPSKEGEL